MRRTISADTAATLTTIMEGVVERGTAKAAQIPGYTVAGKTGTAQKLVDGRYSKSDYNASFVGFVPSRNPAVAIIVVIDSPHAGTATAAASVAAPIFKRIAEADDAVPRRFRRRSTRRRRCSSRATAERPSPQPLRRQSRSQTVAGRRAARLPDTVPDLVGMSARDAMRTLVQLGCVAATSRRRHRRVADARGRRAASRAGVECRLDARTSRRSRDRSSTAQP